MNLINRTAESLGPIVWGLLSVLCFRLYSANQQFQRRCQSAGCSQDHVQVLRSQARLCKASFHRPGGPKYLSTFHLLLLQYMRVFNTGGTEPDPGLKPEILDIWVKHEKDFTTLCKVQVCSCVKVNTCLFRDEKRGYSLVK